MDDTKTTEAGRGGRAQPRPRGVGWPPGGEKPPGATSRGPHLMHTARHRWAIPIRGAHFVPRAAGKE